MRGGGDLVDSLAAEEVLLDLEDDAAVAAAGITLLFLIHGWFCCCRGWSRGPPAVALPLPSVGAYRDDDVITPLDNFLAFITYPLLFGAAAGWGDDSRRTLTSHQGFFFSSVCTPEVRGNTGFVLDSRYQSGWSRIWF